MNYRWLNTVNYDFSNLGAHELDFMLGHEIYSSGGKSSSVTVYNFRESMRPAELFANMALGTTTGYSATESTNQNRLSFFGRANYQFLKNTSLPPPCVPTLPANLPKKTGSGSSRHSPLDGKCRKNLF